LRVRDAVEASSAFAFGGSLLGPGDDVTPSILAFRLYALKKLPVFLTTAGILVVVLIAHGSAWRNGKLLEHIDRYFCKRSTERLIVTWLWGSFGRVFVLLKGWQEQVALYPKTNNIALNPASRFEDIVSREAWLKQRELTAALQNTEC